MARFAYDVNTTRRYIDVFKQFRGGLKTVDTDDALGSVFLRQAQNVSISEFGFIEKRYGTVEKQTIARTGTLQGFWTFNGFDIYAVDNKFYYHNGTTETPINSIAQENAAYRYPTLPNYDSSGFGGSTFRDMNAVNINNVLYIFTGVYPVYVKMANNVPTFYWFSVATPTYDEIVVTGHNLLEDDYEDAYGYTTNSDFNLSNQVIGSLTNARIVETNFHPKIPFSIYEATKGVVNFEFKGQFPGYDAFSTSGSNPYYEIRLDSIKYRTSLPAATASAYTNVNLDSATFTPMNNYVSGSAIDFIQNTVSEAYFVSGETDVIENSSTNLHRYEMTKAFTVEKNDLLKNESYAVRVFKKESSGFVPFNLSQYATGTLGVNFINILITPIDSEGNKLTSYQKKLNTTQTTNTIKFTIPQGLYSKNEVVSYEVLFEHFVTENHSSATGPTNLDTDFASYLAQLIVLGQKTAATSGRLLTSSSVPTLDVALTDLLAGTYDFEVTFAIEQFTYSSSNNLLTIGDIELVSGTIFEVPITVEKLQDFPGQTTDFLPKLKPIWTCNKVIEHYGKLMVWGSTEMPTAIFYSFPDRPTYFPAGFYLDFTNDTNQKIEAVTPFMNILVAQTASQTWGIRGNSGLIDAPAPYVPFGINGTVGTIAPKSVRPVRNHLFFLSRQGIIALKSLYAADEQYNIEFVDRRIRNIVPQDSNAVGIQYDNQYWLNFPKDSITLRWYIDKKAWVKDVYQGWHTTNNESDFGGVFKYQIRDGNLEFITHPSKILNGTNTYLYKMGVDENLPTDLFEPIKAKLETSFLNQNYPFHPKNYKEAKLDFTLQNEYNKGRVTILDSSSDSETAQIQYNTSTTDITISAPDATVRKNHRYRVDFYINPQTDENGVTTYDNVNISTATVEGTVVPDIQLTDSQGNTIPSYILEIPDNLVFSEPLNIVFNLGSNPTYTSDDYIVIRDVTYDDELTFDAYVISEDQTLNFVNTSGYDQATVDIGVDLTEKERLGDWTFGSSDFGKKVTAVKTIKLSGKGYNAKVYLEDVSRSKWTLESLGITYKMKRARSK
jgi:hypothetical protein